MEYTQEQVDKLLMDKEQENMQRHAGEMEALKQSYQKQIEQLSDRITEQSGVIAQLLKGEQQKPSETKSEMDKEIEKINKRRNYA